MAGWYAASVGSVALGPYLALLLVDAGLTHAAASLVLLGMPLARLLGGPLWALLADRYSPEPILRAAVVLGMVGSGALLVPGGPGWVIGAVLVWAWSRSPLFPIVDSTSITLFGPRYGRVRAMGSLGYLVVGALGGVLRDRWPTAPLWLCAGTGLVGALLTFRLPPMTASPIRPTRADLGRLARDPSMALFLAASSLHGAGLALYDQLYAVRVTSLGLPSAVVGASIVSAVGVEVTAMFLATRLFRSVRPERVLVVSMAAGIPRLWLTGTLSDPVALVALQGLHGLHFGTYWLAATTLLAERAPAPLRHTTQALLPSAAFGAGPLLGLLLAATLLDQGSPQSTSRLFQLGAGLAAAAAALGAVWLRQSRPR